MNRNWFETIIGFCVVVLCCSFSYKVYDLSRGESSFRDVNSYFAKFSNIEGISVGSDVKLGGVKIGSVSKLTIDDSLMIVAEIRVSSKVKIPKDSALVISSSTLLGGKYLEIKPGYEDDVLSSLETFSSTKSVVNIEELISKFAFK